MLLSSHKEIYVLVVASEQVVYLVLSQDWIWFGLGQIFFSTYNLTMFILVVIVVVSFLPLLILHVDLILPVLTLVPLVVILLQSLLLWADRHFSVVYRSDHYHYFPFGTFSLTPLSPTNPNH